MTVPSHVGAVVRLAREAVGKTQEQLATEAELPQATISKLENGLIDLDQERLGRIADAVRVPLGLLEVDPAPEGVVALFNRKLLTTPVNHRKTAEARVNLSRLQIGRLLDGLDIEHALPFPKIDLAVWDDDVDQAALELRRAWRLPMGPIHDLTATAESAGAVVATLDFGSLAIDGASQWPAGERPYIFLRPDIPGDRWRFSLAHEIAHMALHQFPSPEQEDEAHRFAGALLMPADELRAQIPARVTLAALLELKMYWRVSMQAIVMRGAAIGAITERQKRSFYQQINARGMKRNEPGEVPREHPRLLESVISAYVDQMGYSTGDVARVGLINEDDLIRRYAPDRDRTRRLRAV